jgi:hypothetical protein
MTHETKMFLALIDIPTRFNLIFGRIAANRTTEIPQKFSPLLELRKFRSEEIDIFLINIYRHDSPEHNEDAYYDIFNGMSITF